MSNPKNIPTFDFYKTLEQHNNFVFSKLENSYNTYNASLPHRHNYFEIIIFKESGGIHEIDFRTFNIQKNTLHFVSPEQVHLLRRNKNVTGFVISFTSDLSLNLKINDSFFDSFPFLNNPYSQPIIELKDKFIAHKVFEIIENIEVEFNSTNHDKQEILALYLSILLVLSRRIYIQNADDEKPLILKNDLTHKFKKLVDLNFVTIKNVTEYASLLNISAGHLNDSLQKGFGKSASEIIYERIILEAKRMLYHSSKSIKEIAAHLNYDDASYFSRFFKTHAKITPDEFRKQIREKYQ